METPKEQIHAQSDADPIIQYIILRQNLYTEQKWTLGSIAAQACHACVAAISTNKLDSVTDAYCSPENLYSMRKVVLELENESDLLTFSDKLKTAGIIHHLWIEQPELVPTCIALKPYYKSEVFKVMRRLKLCKAVIL